MSFKPKLITPVNVILLRKLLQFIKFNQFPDFSKLYLFYFNLNKCSFNFIFNQLLMNLIRIVVPFHCFVFSVQLWSVRPVINVNNYCFYVTCISIFTNYRTKLNCDNSKLILQSDYTTASSFGYTWKLIEFYNSNTQTYSLFNTNTLNINRNRP